MGRTKAEGVATEVAEVNEDQVEAIVAKPVQGTPESETKQLLAILNAQPKRRIRIPKDPSSKVETVCINGYIYMIKRGEECEVPESIFKILADAGII